MICGKLVKKASFLILMLMICPVLAMGSVMAEEDFDRGMSLPESNMAVGQDGAGMTYSGSGFTVLDPLVSDLPVSFYGVSKGVISFDLQRKKNVEQSKGEPPWRTVFNVQDDIGNDLFLFQVMWNTKIDPSRTGFYIRGGELISTGLAFWGQHVALDKEVLPGQWLHVDLVWDDEADRYSFYADSKEVPTQKYLDHSGSPMPANQAEIIRQVRIQGNRPPMDLEQTLASYLQPAVKVVLGVNPGPVSMDAGTSPLNIAVLDNFSIRTHYLDLISEVSHDAFEVAGYSGKLVAGDMVTVTMAAEPGGTASFDLGDSISGVGMTEDQDSPGTYVGSYTVKPGDLVDAGAVTGRLVGVLGLPAAPVSASRTIDIDGRTHLEVNASNDLVPADESARSGLTVVATDANGKAVHGHELKLTMSTTDEYTGTVGGGTFEDLVGGELDVDWGGVTDSFGEVTAQYISGFAAKTILVNAKDMVSGDVGVGWVRSYIEGEVDFAVVEPQATAMSVAGSMEVSLSRDWLTADGQSRSRITAVVKDADGEPLSGHSVRFTLQGDNGSIRVIQGKTDSKGRAFADYIAGTLMGQVQVEVRDMTSGMTTLVSIELRPDAPAEIILVSEKETVVTGGQNTITATVTDANGNPNSNVDVLYDVSAGSGALGSSSVATDEDGKAPVVYTAGTSAGPVTVRGTVMSREPTAEEISAAEGAVFLYGLDDDPGRLDVIEWLVNVDDEVVEGQDLVTLEDRSGTVYTVVAPRDGIVSVFTAEEKDKVEYGDTLGYVLELAE